MPNHGSPMSRMSEALNTTPHRPAGDLFVTTPTDPVTLEDCEAIIERGLVTFIDVGTALLQIRDERLYRQEYRDFETYCQHRWAMTRRHANRLIDAAGVAEVLGPVGPKPVNEAQARELGKVKGNSDPDAMAKVWAEAQEQANGFPTAADIAGTRDRLYPKPKPTFSDDDLDDHVLTQEECEALDARIAADMAASSDDDVVTPREPDAAAVQVLVKRRRDQVTRIAKNVSSSYDLTDPEIRADHVKSWVEFEGSDTSARVTVRQVREVGEAYIALARELRKAGVK